MADRLIAEPPSFDLDVLVVDDDEAVRSSLVDILRSEGFAVAEAQDGEQALERLQEATVGVILLDLHMPRMSWFELLQRLTRRDPPVIVLSANEAQAPQLEGTAEIFAIMRKPPRPDQVLAAVAGALGR